MTPEEVDSFDASYKRCKKVLRRQHEYAQAQAKMKLELIDSPESMNVANWDKLMAWYAGYRNAMRVVMDLTRT
jgi:hypothetical protein